MRQKTLVVIGVMVLAAALLTVLPGSEASAVATSQLVATACGNSQAANSDANIRSAAADVVSSRWVAAEPFPATQIPADQLFAPTKGANPECRSMGFATQVARIFSVGDPLVGKAISSKNAQDYADAVATAPTIERGLVLATAVMFQIRTGFAVVPGGTAQDLIRIQSCLNGKITTNEENKVRGVSLDCSQEAVRQALADTIAPGFYVGFRTNPAVNLSCDDLKGLAETGKTVEARWAAGKALVLDNRCTAKTVAAISAVATGGGSVELRQAAVAQLVPLLAVSNTSKQLLFNAATAKTEALQLANVWAGGLDLASAAELKVMSNCAPTADVTGPLSFWSITGRGESGKAVIAAYARYDASDCSVNPTQFTRSTEELRLTISRTVPGAQLPLQSFVLSK